MRGTSRAMAGVTAAAVLLLAVVAPAMACRLPGAGAGPAGRDQAGAEASYADAHACVVAHAAAVRAPALAGAAPCVRVWFEAALPSSGGGPAVAAPGTHAAAWGAAHDSPVPSYTLAAGPSPYLLTARLRI